MKSCFGVRYLPLFEENLPVPLDRGCFPLPLLICLFEKLAQSSLPSGEIVVVDVGPCGIWKAWFSSEVMDAAGILLDVEVGVGVVGILFRFSTTALMIS